MRAMAIPKTLDESLEAEWVRLARPGTWWSGEERVALARELREARRCALCANRKTALSPESGERHAASPELPAVAVEAIHRISTDPGRLSSQWYRRSLEEGLCPEQVVEIAGLAGIVTLADTLAVSLDGPVRALPTPEAGQPSRERVPGATVHNAWVPMVPPEAAEGQLAAVYGIVEAAAGFVFNVARSLTAVPAEALGFLGVFTQSYTTHGGTAEGALMRPQMEVLAASVSQLNDCFY